MRILSADYIFPITTPPVKNGAITIDNDGTIISIESVENVTPKNKIEYYNGIICPGFVNAHCHLELSHMKSAIPQQLGMVGFIKNIITKRSTFTQKEIENAIVLAEKEMIENGIVAVGDISNNDNTIKQKNKKNIYYHTFIEVFDLDRNKAEEEFNNALLLKKEFEKLSSSITPHAPYSVSDKLFELISQECVSNNSIMSIHNQESKSELELFTRKTGEMFDFFTQMGLTLDYINITENDSIYTTLHRMPSTLKKLFIHNTYTTEKDIQYVLKNNLPENVFWCTCPNANLYIEGRLPDYQAFIKHKAKMTIGTDSLASNTSLSILNEIKTIKTKYPSITLSQLLKWATINGAEFLGISNKYGSIEKGKKPGLNLLTHTKSDNITAATSVQKLI